MKSCCSHIWQAEKYHEHSSAQNQAANEILKWLDLKGDEKILDVGCGDGKITYSLSLKIPKGHITGIDVSPEMISFSRSNFSGKPLNNIEFFLCDAQKLEIEGSFDTIFSSFALQWISDLSYFFKRAREILSKSGHLAITIPLDVSSELENSIVTITAQPKWSKYFENFSPGWHFKKPAEIETCIKNSGFLLKKSNIVTQKKIFKNREELEEYIIQWFSYLSALPENLRSEFFTQIIDKYLQLTSQDQSDSIQFIFKRIDIFAEKITL